MRTVRLVAAVLALVAVAGCSLAASLGGDRGDAVGPIREFGPVTTFEDGRPVQGTSMVRFYETSDGWCTEHAGGKGCAGGSGLPRGFDGFGASGGPDETCVESVTGNMVAELRVAPGDLPPVRLRPLPGSAQAPVNVFAACWDEAVDLEDITVEAFAGDGTRLQRP